jgi:hypothetical protein
MSVAVSDLWIICKKNVLPKLSFRYLQEKFITSVEFRSVAVADVDICNKDLLLQWRFAVWQLQMWIFATKIY